MPYRKAHTASNKLNAAYGDRNTLLHCCMRHCCIEQQNTLNAA
jgi:hypothetical protein